MASSTSSERVRCSLLTSPVNSSGVTPSLRAISTKHAWAGPAVARLDAREVAVGAAVERQVALRHGSLAAQVTYPGPELAQGLVGIVKFVILLQHADPSAGVHSWQSYSCQLGM